jgi:hypothetical protein
MTLCAATRAFRIWCAASGWTDPGAWLEVGELFLALVQTPRTRQVLWSLES